MELETNSIPRYFRPSFWRFFIFFLVTFGGYTFYFAYRNWDAIKVHDKNDINPFWYALIPIVYLYPLFDRMSRDIYGKGSSTNRESQLLAIFIVGSHIFSLFTMKLLEDANVADILIYRVISIFAGIGMYLLFYYIAFRSNIVPVNRIIARGEIIVVVFLIAGTLLSVYPGIKREIAEKRITELYENYGASIDDFPPEYHTDPTTFDSPDLGNYYDSQVFVDVTKYFNSDEVLFGEYLIRSGFDSIVLEEIQPIETSTLGVYFVYYGGGILKDARWIGRITTTHYGPNGKITRFFTFDQRRQLSSMENIALVYGISSVENSHSTDEGSYFSKKIRGELKDEVNISIKQDAESDVDFIKTILKQSTGFDFDSLGHN